MRVVRWGLVAVVALVPGLAWAAEVADVEARMKRDITFLASDECEGRGVATRGINLAADYVAAQFKKAGLKPAMSDGSYFQPFTMNGGTLLAAPQLALFGPPDRDVAQKIELVAGRDYEPLGLGHTGKVHAAELVFAGYGIVAPENVGYNDFAGVDVKGKVVIILRDLPRAGNKFAPLPGDALRYQSLTQKMLNAEKKGAAAVLFVNDRQTAEDGDGLMNFSYTASTSSPAKLPAFHVRRRVVDQLLRATQGVRLEDVESDIDRTLKPASAVLKGWAVSLDLQVRRELDVKNVVGVLDGSGPYANETVVIGAHYDHLGYGGPGSLARLKKPAIHHGADDNASGTTTLIELARRFAAMPKREGRRLVFIAFSGEESGLLGSVYYCKNPLFSLKDTIAMVNLDMVGRLRSDPATGKDKLTVEGVGSAKGFSELLDRLNKGHDFQFVKVTSGYGPSDHASFYGKQIPVVFFYTGTHGEYHRPSDTAETINVAGMRRVADLTEDLVKEFATTAERPVHVKQAPRASTPGQFPRIGIRPDYNEDGKEGVLLEGVSEGGPAEKAGLKAGDRIVEVDGKPVANMEGYMTLIRARKGGDTIDVTVLRGDRRLPFKVKAE